jgi:hypothetical protein
VIYVIATALEKSEKLLSSSPMNLPKVIGLERDVLRSLCSAMISVELRQRATQELTGYDWHCSEHQVIYEALTKIRSQCASSLREQLPAQATRKGFPDIEWDTYLNDRNAKIQNLQDMVRELLTQ